MLVGAGRRKLGAVRVEYVIAGAICVALLSGMTAVLVVRTGGRASRPVQVATPLPTTPRDTSRQQSPTPTPSSPNVIVDVPSQTVEIPVAPRTTGTDTAKTVEIPSAPTVVVIPAAGQTAGTTKAYPSGVAPVLSRGSALRIEAEDFDSGGEGVAYHDTTSQNEGRAYRTNEGADIETSKDPGGGGYVLSFMRGGEWWNYSIRVQDPGEYQLKLRVARGPWGDAKARLRVDGFDKTGEIAIPSTGGFETYKTIDAGSVQIGSTGTKVFRLEAVTGEWNLNWLEFSRAGSSDAGVVVVPIQPQAASPAIVVEIPGGTQTAATPARPTPPVKPTTPAPAAAAGLRLVAEDNFADDKVNTKPAGEGWTWGGAGSMTIQTLPNETEKCLRLVDNNRAGDTWIKRTFSARKERILWSGKVRFGPSADGVGITLMDGDKPAAIAYIKNGEFGAEASGNVWTPIKAANANTWYDLTAQIDIKDKSCTYEFDGVKRKIRLVKDVSQVNSWAVVGAGPTIGTIYVASVRVDAK